MTAPSNAESEGQIAVVAAVVEREGTFLIALRPAAKRHGMLWEFPGGKVRDGESISDALTRELREELEVSVSRVGETLFTADDPGSVFDIHFIETEIEGEPRAVEHTEVRWVRPAELGSLPLAPADQRFAALALGKLATTGDATRYGAPGPAL